MLKIALCSFDNKLLVKDFKTSQTNDSSIKQPVDENNFFQTLVSTGCLDTHLAKSLFDKL